MEVRVYACHLSSVGGGSQREAQDREMFAFLLCHPRSTRVRRTCFVLWAEVKPAQKHGFSSAQTCDRRLGIFSAVDVIMKHVLQWVIMCLEIVRRVFCDKQICYNTRWRYLLSLITFTFAAILRYSSSVLSESPTGGITAFFSPQISVYLSHFP